ncbi:MAG: hypothetical protein QME76_04385 [Bacillota bacterium]|nr:hypothetical protein [Bacillota bacterium]
MKTVWWGLLGCLILTLVTSSWAVAGGRALRILVDGRALETNPLPFVSENQGLSGRTPGHSDIRRNLVSAAALRDLLDDDRDGDLADYRVGHSGGDSIANDPLVMDLRARSLYDSGHLPGAVWIAEASDMGKREKIAWTGTLTVPKPIKAPAERVKAEEAPGCG